jgi:hypothetical protein
MIALDNITPWAKDFEQVREQLQQLQAVGQKCPPDQQAGARFTAQFEHCLINSWSNRWVVATTYRISALDLSALENEQIKHVYLGQRFQAWTASAQNRAATSLIELWAAPLLRLLWLSSCRISTS